MKIKSFLLSFALIGVMNISKVHADLLLEPFYGLMVASTNENGDALSGSLYGGRLGFQNLGFMVGVSTRMGTISADTTPSTDFDFNQYAVFAGYNFPVLFRVWGEYSFGGAAVFSEALEFTEVGGTTFGVGYTALPFVSINFEASSVNLSGVDAAPSAETSFTSYLLSLSFPLTL